MATEMEITNKAAELGIICCTWAPGDGCRRFRFFLSGRESQNYFGPENADYTACGAGEALTYLTGVEAGIYLMSKKE